MKRFAGLFCSVFLFMLMITVMPFKTSASTYSGGFSDDGSYDDDWYFDYYELTAGGYYSSNQERLREYEAGQMV